MSETRDDIPAQRSGGLPPAKFDLSRLTTTDRVVAVASLVAAISIFLPYYSATAYGLTVSQSGTGAHAWLWLEFLVGLALFGYLAACAFWDRSVWRPGTPHEKVLLTATIVQVVLVVIALFTIPYGNQGVGLGWGSFVGLIAALVALGLLIFPAFLRSRDHSKTTI